MYSSDITKSACSYPCFVCTVSLQGMIESLPDCDSQHIWAQGVCGQYHKEGQTLKGIMIGYHYGQWAYVAVQPINIPL